MEGYKYCLISFIIFYGHVCFVTSYSIPPFVRLCPWHDPHIDDCIVRTIYQVVARLDEGIPEMNLPPSDPMQFSNISVATGKSTVDVHLEITDGAIYGLLGAYVLNFASNLDNGSFTSTLYIPRTRIQGNYKIKGNVLLFEVNGAGKADFNATGVQSKIDWSGHLHTIKEKVHLIFDKITVKVQIQDMQINFENLIEGNEMLTQTVNHAINDNIQSLKEDLNPLIEEVVGTIIMDYFNRVFKIFPVKQLYPDD